MSSSTKEAMNNPFTTEEQDAENESIIRMLRSRVAKTRQRIDEIENMRNQIKQRDTEYRLEQDELNRSIKGTMDILNVTYTEVEASKGTAKLWRLK